jgi:peptidyl-prolyl cis-trans isomerase C
VRVGTLELSAEQLALRLGGAAQSGRLQAFAKDPAAANLAYVQSTIVPELLMRAEAERLGLTEKPDFLAAERDVLFRALASAERAQVPEPSPADVEAYYQAHSADFTRPRRLKLWRILVGSEDEARKLIADMAGAGGPERWREASRKLSRDGATRERGGDLGFVHPDGLTDVPELRVDKALFDAADRVKDGEIVPDPMHEGADFAVIWRRGSLTETSVPLDAARETITRLLIEERASARLDALTTELAKAQVSQKTPALVENVDVPAFP